MNVKTAISQNLILLGVPRTVANVVELLSDNKSRTMHEIERESDLRQPEVSTAITILSPFIKITLKNSEAQGRPQKVVCMSPANYVRYIDHIAEKQERQYSKTKDALEMLMKEE
jgi:predicted transcriptional regulator